MSLLFLITFLYHYFSRRHFKILDTIIFRKMKGARTSRGNVRLRIRLVLRRPADQLVFDELWIEDRLCKIRITEENIEEATHWFTTRRIVYIDAEAEAAVLNEAILQNDSSKSEIILGYQVNNKRRYQRIDDFFGC